MKNRFSIVSRFWVVFAILLGACGNDLTTAQGVVEEFVDQRFVHFDLAKARLYAVSLALAKVNEEIRLTAGQKIDASTQKPRINYKLLEKERATDGRRFSMRERLLRMTALRSPANG